MRSLCFLLLPILAYGSAAAAASNYTRIHQFKNKDTGCNPTAGLTAGPAGTYFGTTSHCGKGLGGTVFELTPPDGQTTKWTLNTIWAFHGPDGSNPEGAVLAGKDGALYGTTTNGVNDRQYYGTIFKLTPPAKGTTRWRFQRLYAFGTENVGGKGGNSESGLIQDSSGALYGTTSDEVFKLSPPQNGGTGPWAYQSLARYGEADAKGSQPNSPLVMGANGVLYGTAFGAGKYDGGVVFTVTPPANGGTEWTKKTVWQFQAPDSSPFGGLVAGGDGSFYGTTTGLILGTHGTIFRVTPPAAGKTRWTEETLYQFTGGADGSGPVGALTADGHGGFYGAAQFGGGTGADGTIFHVVPPAKGGNAWTLNVLHSYFPQTGTNNPYTGPDENPEGGLILDPSGALLGTTLSDVKYYAGSVFRLVPRD